jgi:flagellar hook assembly protein FlgD
MAYQASVNNFVPGGTTLVNNVQAVYTGQTAPLNASAVVTVTGDYTVKIGVYNEAGELIQSLPVSQYSQSINNINLQSNAITALTGAGSESVIYFDGVPIGTWNGLDSTGTPTTNGNYYVKVESVDPMGVVTTVTQPVNVNRSIYKVTIAIYNESGEVVRNLFAYASNPGPANATQVTLSSSVLAPTSGNPVYGELSPQPFRGLRSCRAANPPNWLRPV